jgi:predicted DNA-binding transcriptional regulator AlpA
MAVRAAAQNTPFGTSARPRAAAEFLGIGLSTFWRWAANRSDFPKGRALSSRVRVFDLNELAAWRDAQGGAR